MLDEIISKENIQEDELLPKEIDSLPLETEATSIVNDIIKADNVDDLKSLASLFSLNQAKKNAIRIIKLNNLLDAVNDQAIQRFTKRPDEVSNKEILEYMKTVQEQIDKSQKTLDNIGESPIIQINNQKNEVNINVGGELDRDSRERVINAIQELLKQAQTDDVISSDVIDVTSETGGEQ